MARDTRLSLARALRLGVFVAASIGVVTGLFAWRHAERERGIDLDDTERRARVLAQQLSGRVLETLGSGDPQAPAALAMHLDGYRRLLGYAVFDAQGNHVATGRGISEFADRLAVIAAAAHGGVAPVSSVELVGGLRLHLLAEPLTAGGQPAGVLVVAHDLSELDARATGRLVQYGFWVVIVTLLAVTLVVGSTWLAYERPLAELADWMRRVRVENLVEAPPPGLPTSELRSESDRLAASFRAARSTGRMLSQAALHAEHVWTPDRLRAHALAALGEARQLIVVSNREPYMHQRRDGRARMIVPAGGLVTALDPVLQACGGVWIAHGAGDADRETADAGGRLTVPPEDPRYTLRRVWLSREEEKGYYYGFSNEGLWPLCHLAHERPVFRSDDWEQYGRVNRRFAEAVLDEVGSGEAVVLVQDYQLALVPRLLKQARSDLRVGLFWHIPWPTAEAFRICPWAVEILQGMLAADLIGFHLPQYCGNFLDTVDRTVESRIDRDHHAVELGGSRTEVRPFPISVQPWGERHVLAGEALAERVAGLRAQHQLGDAIVAVGVDRIDYTKGLPERFRACARLLERWPEYRGRFTLVSLGAPSRTHIRRYREYLDELEALADEINWQYQTDTWKPIRFLVAHHDPETVHAFLSMATMCVVSSLHDGMNLVAKEYVAAQAGGDGVLVLSAFAGAAGELVDALVVNPYDIEGFAEALRVGLEMDPAERRRRMQRLSSQVDQHNIYRWAANVLTALATAPRPVALPLPAQEAG